VRYSTSQIFGELALIRALEKAGIKNPNLGLTDYETRKENIRLRITDSGIGWHSINDLEGGNMTVEQFFRRVYGEDLKNG
jgi:hypothetical protein